MSTMAQPYHSFLPTRYIPVTPSISKASSRYVHVVSVMGYLWGYGSGSWYS